jgi:RNA-directed DNA polymerase
MTKPRQADDRAAGSQELGQAQVSPYAGDSSCAWNVNFNNGNANWNNRNNDGFVRAVRGPLAPAGECQHAVALQDLYRAWRTARRAKQPSANQLDFEIRWADRLIELQRLLEAGTWSPAPPTCFIAKRPKAREIHAPDFADRVVHHWLVPQLEAVFEPTFLHDSYANRADKGTHAAVARLESFVRQVHSGQGGGWYLQLDIRTFFNSIHRPTLWTILKRRLVAAGLPTPALHATHALVRSSPLAGGVIHRSSAAERAKVPLHKRLENAAPGCGLPIGNLSSQFLANVYLDRLDQYVKRKLRVPRYLRYVDDFVLVHHDRAQLEAWRVDIERFVREQLRLELKPDIKLRPLTAGIDFLGYVVYPTHTRIRRRVIAHGTAKLQAWQRAHVHGAIARATPQQYRQIRSVAASYEGHYRHGDSFKLRQQLHQRFPWLAALNRSFDHRLEGSRVEVPIV